jgi:hypothetical protein
VQSDILSTLEHFRRVEIMKFNKTSVESIIISGSKVSCIQLDIHYDGLNSLLYNYT